MPVSVEMTEDGRRIRVETSPVQKDLIASIPGSRYDSSEHVWHVPLTWAACLALRGVFGDQLAVGPDLTAWSQHRRQAVDAALHLKTLSDHDGNSVLYPHQRVAGRFLAEQSALLTDEMGLGKTLSVIDATLRVNTWPVLVICPNSVKHTWQSEYERWAPTVRVVVVEGNITKRRKALKQISDGEADVAVINYEALRSHSRLAGYGSIALSDKEKEPKELNEIMWAIVVADEAHRLKDPKAKQTRAAKAVAFQPNVQRRWALTGTPVANGPADLWSVMNFVHPEEWPAKTKFIDRYTLSQINPWGGLDVIAYNPATIEEMRGFFEPRHLRRTTEEVGINLPPQRYIVRETPMAPKQAKAYKNMRDRLVAELEDGSLLTAPDPMVNTLRLLQFSAATATMDEDGKVALTTPSGKLDVLKEVIAELGERQAVVFCVSRGLSQMLAAESGADYVLLDGSIPTDERHQYVEAFQDGKVQFAFCTYGAMSEGVTLTAADTMIRVQRPWSLVQDQQAAKRVHRIGQDKPVLYVDLVTPDTVEESVTLALEGKNNLLSAVLRDEDRIRSLLNV